MAFPGELDAFDFGMDVVGGRKAPEDQILDEMEDEWSDTLDEASLKVLCEGVTTHNLKDY